MSILIKDVDTLDVPILSYKLFLGVIMFDQVGIHEHSCMVNGMIRVFL